jgi:hypothetical protein
MKNNRKYRKKFLLKGEAYAIFGESIAKISEKNRLFGEQHPKFANISLLLANGLPINGKNAVFFGKDFKGFKAFNCFKKETIINN